MSSFFSDPTRGGNGNTYTDDNDASTGLGNGGFWTRLVPMLSSVIGIASYCKTQADTALQYVLEAQGWATTAVNSPGTSATSTSSITVGTGAKTCTIQTGKALVVGQYITVSRTSAPATTYMDAKITSYNSGTGTLGFEVSKVTGAGTFTDWTIGLAGAPSSGGLSGSTFTTLTSRQQLTLTTTSTQVQRLTAPGYGCSVVLPAGNSGLAKGSDVFCLFNDGEYPIGVLDNTLQVIGQILPGDNTDFHLTDSSTVAGAWAYSHNLDPWWTVSETGANLWQTVQLFKIDENRSLVFYQNHQTYPCVRYLAHPADGTMTLGNEYVLDTMAGAQILIADCALITNSRVLTYSTGNKLQIIDYSAGPTLTYGTPLAHGMTSTLIGGQGWYLNWFGNQQHFMMLSYAANSTMYMRVFDCGASGTTITAGAVTNDGTVAPAGSFQRLISHAIDANSVGVFYTYHDGTGYRPVLRSYTRTGTAIVANALTALPTNWNASNNTQNTSASNCYFLSGHNWFTYYSATTNPYSYWAVITFGTTCTWNTPVITSMTAGSQQLPQITKIGTAAWLAAHNSGSGANNLEVVTVSGTTPSKSITYSVDVTDGASGIPTISCASSVDGRGIISYTLSATYSSKTAYKGFAWNGSTLSLGTRMMPSGSSNQNVFGVNTLSRSVTEAGGTVIRTVSAMQYQQSASSDYTATIATFTIDSSGNVTYGGFSKPHPGQQISPTAHAANKGYFATANQGDVTHGVILNGKLKIGRGSFRFPQGIDIALNSNGGISKLENDHRPDRTCSFARVRFAEV